MLYTVICLCDCNGHHVHESNTGSHPESDESSPALTSHFFTVNLISILLAMPRFSKWSVPLRLLTIFQAFHVCYVQIMKVLGPHVSPDFCYSLQHHVLIHPQSLFFPHE
jgi:hypothetical protein